MFFKPAFVILWAGFLIAGCAPLSKTPDMARLYAEATTETQPPVVLIHGLMGSKINNSQTGEELWPSSVRKLLFSSYKGLALDITPETLQEVSIHRKPVAIFDRIAGRDFYGKILQALEHGGGYTFTELGQPITSNQRRYYVFLYDWRQDNVTSAKALAAFIQNIQQDYGNPAQKVDIVAHSMGGLIARYYMRYGRQDVVNDNAFDTKLTLGGGKNIRRMILLGTPNWGSVSAVKTFIRGHKLGFSRIQPQVLATMPSLYQLFPHPIMAEKTLITAAGSPLKRDLYDVRIWQKFRWSVFDPKVQKRIRKNFDTAEEADAYQRTLEAFFEKSLERARRFAWSLSIPLPKDHPKLVVFGGDCALTPAKLLIEEVAGDSVIRLNPHEVQNPHEGIDYNRLMLEPGDGTVTKASLLARQTFVPTVSRHKYSFFPLEYAFFLCEAHNSLTGNPTFQNNLLHSLLSVD